MPAPLQRHWYSTAYIQHGYRKSWIPGYSGFVDIVGMWSMAIGNPVVPRYWPIHGQFSGYKKMLPDFLGENGYTKYGYRTILQNSKNSYSGAFGIFMAIRNRPRGAPLAPAYGYKKDFARLNNPANNGYTKDQRMAIRNSALWL